MNKSNISLGFIFAAIICILAAAQSTSAATRTVDNTTDNAALTACTAAANDCSLRGAIDGAADGDTINFASPLFDSAQTITLANADPMARVELIINKTLTITGRGARLLTLQGTGTNPRAILVVQNNAGDITVSLSGMTITDGDSGIGNDGQTVTLNGMNISGNSGAGGIYNSTSGTMTILNSLVSSNTSTGGGGGIDNSGTMTIANTTISGNTTNLGTNPVGGSGGIYNGAGILSLNNVTIANNLCESSSTDSTGGLYNTGENLGTVNIRNTIISNNRADNSTSDDVRGAFVSNGNNLVRLTTGSTGFTQSTDITGMTAILAPLTNAGGQTNTQPLMMGSPAINAGSNCVVNQSCGANNPPIPLTTDQRASTFLRQSGGTVDIGAFERQQPTAAGATVAGWITESNGRGIFRVLVTMTDSQGNQRQAYTNPFGYFQFNDVVSGQVYVFTAQHRRYSFDQPTQVEFIGEETNQINFTGSPSNIFRFDIWNVPMKGNQ